MTTTTSPPVTTTSPDGTSTSTGSDDIEGSTTEFTCGCPDDIPVDLDSELRAGFTPNEALALFQGLSIPLEWVGYEGSPVTVLHAEAAYVGGTLTEGPGGDDGCLFLNSPCNDGVVMEVELSLSTDDGALVWTTPARIVGKPDTMIELGTDLQDIAGNAGTLASWPLQVRGMPFVVAELETAVSYDPDGPFVHVVGWSAEGESLLLGTDE